jgi:hypothetical protein
VGVALQADASLQTYLPTDFGTEVSATASVTDRFQVYAQREDGHVVGGGTMDIDLLATGTVTLSGDGSFNDILSFAALNYQFNVWGQSGSEQQFGNVSLDHTDPRGTILVSAPLSATISWFGDSVINIELKTDAQVIAKLELDGVVNGRVVFGNSLDWVGIRNVRDENGNLVASFSAVSPDTGILWGGTAPVPEPAATGLFALGLAMLAVRRRSTRVARPDAQA